MDDASPSDVGAAAEETQVRFFEAVGPDQTRLCTDPWDTPYVNTDGTVKPCCWIHDTFGDLREEALPAILNNRPYRKLKAGLLDGKLRKECSTCVDRPVGSKADLAEMVRRRQQLDPAPTKAALVNANEVRTLMVSVTEKCNLRCVYCLVSGPTYDGKASEKALLLKLADDLAGVETHDVVLNGHGETTFFDGWQEVIEAFGKLPTRLSLTSNLSRLHTDDEIATLSRLNRLIVSVDSIDRAEQLKIRRGSDIRTILYNLARVLERWGEDPAKAAIIQTVLSREVVQGYDRLVRVFLRLGIRQFWLCNLVYYTHAADAVAHVAAIETAHEYRAAMTHLARAAHDIAAAGAVLEAQAGLVHAIEARGRELGVAVDCMREGDRVLKLLIDGRPVMDEALAGPLIEQQRWLAQADPAGLAFSGNMDGVSDTGVVSGWARCDSDPDRALVVEAVLDGRVVGAGLADLERVDLAGIGLGAGRYGYRIETGLPLRLLQPSALQSAGVFVRIARNV